MTLYPPVFSLQFWEQWFVLLPHFFDGAKNSCWFCSLFSLLLVVRLEWWLLKTLTHWPGNQKPFSSVFLFVFHKHSICMSSFHTDENIKSRYIWPLLSLNLYICSSLSFMSSLTLINPALKLHYDNHLLCPEVHEFWILFLALFATGLSLFESVLLPGLSPQSTTQMPSETQMSNYSVLDMQGPTYLAQTALPVKTSTVSPVS